MLTLHVFTSTQRQPFNLCCAEAYAKFTEMKRLRVHPGKMTKERDAVRREYLYQVYTVERIMTDRPMVHNRWKAARQMYTRASNPTVLHNLRL